MKKINKRKGFYNSDWKEIHLLEILLNSKEPISKNEILAKVWNYSSDTDTHTVETHIYRLRKKINEKFSDDNFLLNNKKGYYLWKKEIKLQSIYLVKNIVIVWLSQKKEKEASKEKKNNFSLFLPQ